MRLCADGGRAFRRGTCPRRTATSFAPVRPQSRRLTARAPGRRYEPGERRSDYALPKCGQAFAFSRVLARRLALPLLFVAAAAYHCLAVARTRDADRLQRRAPLRRSSRSRSPPDTDSRFAASRSSSPLRWPARAVARLAPQLDARRVHRGQDPQRGRHVGRGLPRVLACARAGRPAVVRAAHRRRSSRDAGDVLPRVSHVRGARVSGLPRSPSPSSRSALAGPLAPDGARGARPSACSPSRRASSSSILPLVYLAGVALCGRGAYRRHALPAALRRCSSSRARRASRRPRHSTARRDASASVMHRRRSRTGRS